MSAPKVLFLDFDGVVTTTAALMATEEWFDPVAFGLVRLACEELGLTIVVSSAWRKVQWEPAQEAMSRFGLKPFLHATDPRTPDLGTRRGPEIQDWLDRNGNPEFWILDDESDMLPDQMSRLIQTNGWRGFGLHEFNKLTEFVTAGAERRAVDPSAFSFTEKDIDHGNHDAAPRRHQGVGALLRQLGKLWPQQCRRA